MSALDLHPEELLDKAAAGTLTDTEQTYLDQHLQQCSVCRFEQKARADFMSAPVAAAQVDDLVARALAGMPTKQTPGRRRTPWALAAAVAMFAVASFGAVGKWTGLIDRVFGPAPAPEVMVPKVRAPEVKQPLPELPTVEMPEEVVVAAAPARAPVKRATVVVAAAPKPLNASELFAAANEARIRGDRAEAALRYGELLRNFPSSDEARLTHATLGRMLLDLGDAKGALQQLDVYLALGDETLREEAMSARARALALLGRTGEEAAAWNSLLQLYPDSVHAERARARLQELR